MFNLKFTQVKFTLALISFVLTSSILAQPNGTKAENMIYIPGGSYVPMYSLDSQRVNVEPFYIDQYPVTNEDFKAFVSENPQWKKSNVKKLFADQNYLNHWDSDTSFDIELAQSPVVFVSWFAANKYCEYQGKRLPVTAEWEIVAKASEKSPDGNVEEGFNRWLLMVTSKPRPAKLPPVGSTFRNYFGVDDMHGFIWEWTFDFNSALTTGESRGNSSLDNTLFCGGGSFSATDLTNYVSFLRFAMRSSLKANYTVHNVGFRCRNADERR